LKQTDENRLPKLVKLSIRNLRMAGLGWRRQRRKHQVHL